MDTQGIISKLTQPNNIPNLTHNINRHATRWSQPYIIYLTNNNILLGWTDHYFGSSTNNTSSPPRHYVLDILSSDDTKVIKDRLLPSNKALDHGVEVLPEISLLLP